MGRLRLYHHPVAVTFLFTDTEREAFAHDFPEHVIPARPLTYCQWELAARMQGRVVLGSRDRLSCTNAQISFGWRPVDEREIHSQLKYCRDEEQTRRFLEARPCLEQGSLKAVAVQPLGSCRATPHVVRFLCDSLQAYHLAVDYMASMDTHPLRTALLMSSSSCGGSVWCMQNASFNIMTPCPGAYNAGKMERGEINIFIPGFQLEGVVTRMREREARYGSVSVTSPGDCFPGADICKNCPLIRFRQDGASCATCSNAGAAS